MCREDLHRNKSSLREAHNRLRIAESAEKKRATTSVKKRGRFACKAATGARFSEAL